MMVDISDVSVVICTRNNKDNIRDVVQSVLDENPREVIVVDGNSTDGTREILEKLNIRILTDPGKGLALARQIALEKVRGEYTLFVGDDNIINKGGIGLLKNYMLEQGWVGVAFQTRIKDANCNYWSYCSNQRWQARFFEGPRSVIGTPYMFRTDLLKTAGYDAKCTVSDDSDMERRLRTLTEKEIGYSNVTCFEIGKTNRHETIVRFLMYGKSDAEFWKKYSPNWTLKRKIQSILHPFRDELINPLHRIKSFKTKIKVLPYFVFITIIRYIGWLKEAERLEK